MLQCENIVLLTVRFLDVAKFTTLISLSLLIWCKLSFQFTSLKMSSLLTLALKPYNKIFIRHVGNSSNIPVPHRSCHSHHQFYPLLRYEHSEQWYDTSDLLVLYTMSCHELYPLNCWYDSLMHKRKLYLINDSHSRFCRKMRILLLGRCHHPPIWPSASPQNLIYMLIVLLILSLVNLPIQTSYVQCTESHVHIA
jgi:hypothetical protein